MALLTHIILNQRVLGVLCIRLWIMHNFRELLTKHHTISAAHVLVFYGVVYIPILSCKKSSPADVTSLISAPQRYDLF